MSTIKVDTIATRTGSGNITASNTIAGTNITASGTLGVTGNTTVGGTLVNTGLITASAGVAIGGTGAANTLDDYEEGTCTLTWHGTGGTNDSTNTNIKYVKIGKFVNVSGSTNSATPNATGPLELQGLPFTAEDDGMGAVLYRQTTAGSGQHSLVFYIGANQSKIEPYWAAQGNYDRLNSSDFNGTGQDMYFSVTYPTTS